MDEYLESTETMDFDHPAVRKFARENAGDSTTPAAIAVNFYYAVRDGIRYDPYSIELSTEGLRASATLCTRRGWCVPKAILLAACCRSAGIPARLGFADVRNHLSTARMRAYMNTDVFFWHGFASIYLDGTWIKATPAFNIGLCERFHLKPLEFDGRGDAIYQPFDDEGNRHMEYVRYRGEFADVPISLIADTFRREYPLLSFMKDLDFDSDAETGRAAH